MEKSDKYWHLYGKKYDLTNFLEKHPGGAQILQVTKGGNDLTPMFESYHAFADLDKLKQDLETFKIGESQTEQMYTFKKGDFYDTIRERVKLHFGKSRNVNHMVKLNKFFVCKVVSISIVYLLSLYYAFVASNQSTLMSCIFSFINGVSLLSLAFCVFHDASHFALFRGNFQKNDVFARILGAMLFWQSELWMKHHSFRHHAYTGNENLDPDILNYYPFIRKTDRVEQKKYMSFPYNLIPYITTFVLLVFPGQFVGQVIVYWFQWKRKGHLWKMQYPKEIINRKIYENMIILVLLFCHLYKFNIFVTISYILSVNISYAFAIVPDHDTRETHLNFDLDKKDWGETQVRNSGNFGNKQWGDIYNHLFGGINYQIEHHLFPSMCGVHLNKIAPIVKQTCKEFGIPYVSHKGAIVAFTDFLDGVKELYQGKKEE